MRRSTTLLVAAAMTAACATSGPKTRTLGGDIAPVTPPNGSWIPAGTSMQVKLNQSLSTASSRKGDSFTATVVNPVFAQDGFTAVPAGSLLRGRITGIFNSSKSGEQSLIRLAFEDLQMRGHTYPVTASISNVVPVDKQTIPASTATTVRTAGVGTVLSGSDLSRIVANGILGAATGTVISLGPGGNEGVLPAGATLTVRTNDQVVVR